MVERTYVIPLRKGFSKAPKYRRAKKAINTIREFLVKHMKSDDVRLGTHLNLEVWEIKMRTTWARVLRGRMQTANCCLISRRDLTERVKSILVMLNCSRFDC